MFSIARLLSHFLYVSLHFNIKNYQNDHSYITLYRENLIGERGRLSYPLIAVNTYFTMIKSTP